MVRFQGTLMLACDCDVGCFISTEPMPHSIRQLPTLRPEELSSSPCLVHTAETQEFGRKYIEIKCEVVRLLKAAIEVHPGNLHCTPAPTVSERIPCHLATHHKPCSVSGVVRRVLYFACTRRIHQQDLIQIVQID